MADDDRDPPPSSKTFGCFKLSFGKSSSSSAASSSHNPQLQRQNASRRDTAEPEAESSNSNVVRDNRINIISNSVVSAVKSIFPALYLLKPDPFDAIYFPYEPDRRVRGAVKITNTSKFYVAFKLEINKPGSVMRPQHAIISPGASKIPVVYWFIHYPKRNKKPIEKKRKIQFRLLCMKLNGLNVNVEQLFAEQRHKVIVQQILYAVFLDSENSALEKSKKLLAESDVAYWADMPSSSGTHEDDDDDDDDAVWRARRERYLEWMRTHVYDGSKRKVGEDN